MLKNKQVKKVLSLLLSLFMVLGYFTSFAYAEGDQLSSAKENLYELIEEKITDEVKKDINNEDLSEVLVYMENQVDTEKVADNIKFQLSSAATPYHTKLKVRNAVIESLKDTAEMTQTDILKYLEEEMEKGNVVEFTPYHIVNTIYVKATKEVIENLAYMPEVEKIYKNKTHTLDIPETDDSEIELSATGVEWNIERVKADQVWDLGYDGTGIVVANIDSGVKWDHPALKNKWRGYDPVTGETNPDGNWFDPVYNSSLPEDSDSHGTHVMGTMVGQEPDGSNKIGVAPGAKWIAARVFNRAGSTTDRILLDAAQWMLAPGGDPNKAPDVVNNSWNGGAGIDDWYRDAVKNWRAAGIFPVFSAGNQRTGEPAPWPGSISCPANYPESFAVAATDRNNARAYFSKLGPSPYNETLIKPNISAPGVNIKSSIPNGYGNASGTSMAAPAISGVVALLLSANASLTIEDIEDILTDTAIPLTDTTYPTGPNFGYGYGMVDAFEAVSSVATGTGYISGRVLIPGEDSSEPEIVHEQEISKTYMGSDVEILAEVSDDVSITEVELLVKQKGKSYWMIAPMEKISGDHKNGTYKGTITHDMLEGDSIAYKIKARDFAGDIVVTPDYHIDIEFGIIPGEYTQGFESNLDGWTFNGAWEWGVPSNTSPTPFEGEKLAGTILNGNYPNNTDSWMITPPIDLRNKTLETANLKFNEWYDTENNYDKGYVLVTNDYGETWTEVGPIRTGSNRLWQESVVDLKNYIGSLDPLFVAFRFTSDVSVQRVGWYIDNVRLTTEEVINSSILYKKSDINMDINTITPDSSDLGVNKEEMTKPNYVEPSKPKYNLKKNIMSKNQTVKTIDDREVQKMPMIFTGIPVSDAVVTVLETGRSVKVDPATGKFFIRVPIGDYTLKAEAYGYFDEEVSINVEENQTAKVNLVLEPKPTGSITGRVIDRYYKTPAAHAKIRIAEDPKVPQVIADEEGYFTIEKVYEGRYTLKVAADGFEPGEAIVDVYGDTISDVEVELKRFVGYEDDIIYDDGTGENALVLNSAGYGLAVRFTPQQFGKVKGTNVYFWDTSWPTPGGNRIGFVIYGLDDNGVPYKVGEPIFQDIVRGEWNYIDLSSFEFSTDKDFYISTIQGGAGTSCPATGIDESSSHGDRSYMNLDGEFKLVSEEDITGGLMIRARMEYGVSVPVITNLEQETYTNQDIITVEGTVTSDGKINVYVNEEKVNSIESQNKKFSVQINLPQERNEIKITAEMNGVETEPSVPVIVIKDKLAPVLVVEKPLDNTMINTEVIHVAGNVKDNIGLAKVEINEKEIKVDEEGNFYERLMVDTGENIITINATDRSGNETKVIRTVVVELETPSISNILPDEDVNIKTGDELTVSFNAPEGGKGYFRVLLPFGMDKLENNEIGIPMIEENGVYTGTWKVPEKLEAEGLLIQVVYISKYGNEVTKMAKGKVNIILDEESEQPAGIMNLQPNEDVELKKGESVEISFEAPERGKAHYRIILPSEYSMAKVGKKMRMKEVRPGFYSATYKANGRLIESNLEIEVTFKGKDGTTITEIAKGRLTLVGEMQSLPDEPITIDKPITIDEPIIIDDPIIIDNPVIMEDEVNQIE